MSAAPILIVGGGGFLGAWIARRLHARGVRLRIFDLAARPPIFEMIAGDLSSQVDWRFGDVVDAEAVLRAAEGCGGVVSLAGLLTPACRADPVRGAKVNLIGTLNVFEAARRHGIGRIAYASSAGVFGPGDAREPRPQTHYGAFKLACEGSARAYFVDHGLSSVGFRPFVIYGPGRESGLTAGPSLACRAAARGERYVIPYGGRAGLVYVEDVATAFESALFAEPKGARVFNLVGERASNEDVVAAIHEIVPGAEIGVEGPDIGISAEIDEGDLDRELPGIPRTSLREGVARSIDFYRGAHS